MDEIPIYGNNQLIALVKSGDIKAFKILYDSYCRQLINFILKYLPEEADAEEILQDVFLSLWENHTNLQPNKSIKSYLFQIAVNKVYNHLKRKVVERKYQHYLSMNGSVSGNDVEDKIYFEELEETIGKILVQLPNQQCRIFQLSRIEEMSHAEIAKKLSLSVRTVENQIYRAHKFVKNKLTGDLLILYLIIDLFNSTF